jgi:bisphosphoglycerate-independent phosphoglycerate mutase (AlkP superfamily)
MREYGVGKIASINGRYYAMDRDKRWERERKAFDAMVNGKAEGGAYADPVARIKECYNNGVTDEFLIPFVVVDARASRSARFATRMCASTSTSAPTAPARLPACWPARAA